MSIVNYFRPNILLAALFLFSTSVTGQQADDGSPLKNRASGQEREFNQNSRQNNPDKKPDVVSIETTDANKKLEEFNRKVESGEVTVKPAAIHPGGSANLSETAVTIPFLPGVNLQAISEEEYNKKKSDWVKKNPEAYQQMLDEIAFKTAPIDAPPVYPRFISFPVSEDKPFLIETEKPKEDEFLYKMRLQHWYFIYDQTGYRRLYGALPVNLPGGLTPEQYAANPPFEVPNEVKEAFSTKK